MLTDMESPLKDVTEPEPANPPNVTSAPGANPEPLIDTRVPPAMPPEAGDNDEIVGRTYVNPFALVADEPSGFVTATSTPPGAWGGVDTVIPVLLANNTAVATPPNVTVAFGENAEPLIETEVPPTVVPNAGERKEIVGRMYVNAFAIVAVCASGLVTTTFTSPAA